MVTWSIIHEDDKILYNLDAWSPITFMKFFSMYSGPIIHRKSPKSSGNIHWSCFLRAWTGWSGVIATGWPGLTFTVMVFTLFAVWRTVAGAVTGSVISDKRWLLALNTVSEVLEKYAQKLIWLLRSSGSVTNYNSHLLGCADADPSRKNESGSMSEETGGSGFPETVGWASVYGTGSFPCFLLAELLASTLNKSKLKW